MFKRLKIGLTIIGVALLALGFAQPAAAQNSYATAVKAVAPSIVTLQAANVAPNGNTLQQQGGSGVIVSAEGLVLTSLHVVQQASSLQAQLPSGERVPARVVAQEAPHDMALVQLTLPAGVSLTPATFADSKNLTPGDVVLSVGNPYGVGQSVSVGVVSALNRTQVLRNAYQPFIQTDAAIAPGQSGGALINTKGAVVGLVAATAGGAGAKGLGFALPTQTILPILADWRAYGGVRRAWFGAEGRLPSVAEAQSMGMPQVQGAMLSNVLPSSPAAQAGLQAGDVLLAIAGQAITAPSALGRDVAELRTWLGRPLPLQIWRAGKLQEVQITLTSAPPQRRAERRVMRGYNPLNGVTLEPMSAPLAQSLGLPFNTAGVAVVALSVQPLNAYGQKFQVGDVIQLINKQPTPSPRAAQGALETSRKAWEVRLVREGETQLMKF